MADIGGFLPLVLDIKIFLLYNTVMILKIIERGHFR